MMKTRTSLERNKKRRVPEDFVHIDDQNAKDCDEFDSSIYRGSRRSIFMCLLRCDFLRLINGTLCECGDQCFGHNLINHQKPRASRATFWVDDLPGMPVGGCHAGITLQVTL